MSLTYEIEPGNEYEADGYRITSGLLFGWGAIGIRADGSHGITWSGSCFPGSDRAELEVVIRAVLTDGIARRVVSGAGVVPVVRSPSWKSPRGLSLSDEMDLADSVY